MGLEVGLGSENTARQETKLEQLLQLLHGNNDRLAEQMSAIDEYLTRNLGAISTEEDTRSDVPTQPGTAHALREALDVNTRLINRLATLTNRILEL